MFYSSRSTLRADLTGRRLQSQLNYYTTNRRAAQPALHGAGAALTVTTLQQGQIL